MPPKKATTTKKAASTASHPPYQDMIKEAVVGLKEKGGSSRQALKKYVQANNNLSGVSDAVFTAQFNKALQKGSDSGVFARPKGTSGPVKLAAPGGTTKPAAKKATATKPKTATKTATTKKAAPKKTATKTSTKKAPAKKTATKSKANTSKARKAPAAAPAVEDKPPVVLGKTKSGRVTKSKAQDAGVKKAIAPKKTRKVGATKKATPAKKA